MPACDFGLVGGIGYDSIAGGDGDDVVAWSRGDGNDSIDGGGGKDLVVVYGAASSGGFHIRARSRHVKVGTPGARVRHSCGPRGLLYFWGLAGYLRHRRPRG